MSVRLLRSIPFKRPRRLGLVLVGAVVGFVAVVAVNLRPSAPESRLPGAYRLAALIERQQVVNNQSRGDVQRTQQELQTIRQQLASQRAGVSSQNDALDTAGTRAGLNATKGTGFTVVLDDSVLDQAPTGNNNDLVIHSQDVQAVVNALWRSGATAMSVNGQRLISTSAVLCVGNTLLLNGAVYSPPYEVSAIGASRSVFQDDELVKGVRDDATRFSLRFSVGREQSIDIPAYSGPTAMKYAQPVAK